jgi:hypothetical protein
MRYLACMPMLNLFFVAKFDHLTVGSSWVWVAIIREMGIVRCVLGHNSKLGDVVERGNHDRVPGRVRKPTAKPCMQNHGSSTVSDDSFASDEQALLRTLLQSLLQQTLNLLHPTRLHVGFTSVRTCLHSSTI